jgi:hypothetical protein
MIGPPPGHRLLLSCRQRSSNVHKERTTPHVVVKLWPGKSDQQKTRLAEAITKDLMDILHHGEEVGFGSNGRN